ncbi:RHS repeat-associated core domain-containing protein [Paludibaculum fermentans]|uniref:RHS repeat-associated core domain-containing protein n=2 Tax=Paludibaculum fermentans TaxID=1473598 RepID=A0A7S7NX96_PALFE|nr:RHS repeat-associated core domain-containing protein [Paludibaculum fermentans]
MGVPERQQEPKSVADSGTIYPTAFYDRNGNYIIAGYASGIGTNLADSSGRISWISDVRANASYGKSYDFVYTSTGLPHLTQINNNVGLGEEYALSYSTSQALKSPFTPNAQFATVDLLTGVNITNLGVPHLFEYGTNQAGELTKVTFPYGGVVEWAYTNFLFGNGKTFREVNSRKLTSQPNGTQLTYGIAATDTGTPLFAHKARTVSDANGRDTRVYTLDDVATSISYGASTAFEQRDTSLTYPVLLHRDDTWTTDIKGNVYLNSSTTTLDPNSSGVPKVSRVEIDRDGWGNVTEQRLFDYGLTSPTLKRKYKNTYSYGLGWVGINNLLVKSEIIEGTTTVQTATYDYDTGPAGSCPANSTNLTDVTDITEHDARYSTSLTWRGNVTYVAVLGKAPVCLSYNIGGTVVKSQTVGGIAVDYSVTSASHYTMPSVVTPNGESNLASSSQFNTFLGLSSTTGPNSATAAFTYDSMTRPSTTTSALGAVTNYAYTNAVVAGPSSTLATSTATTNGKWVRTTVDGLGRPVKVERGNGSTVVSIVDTEYGPCACSAVGKVKRVSQPYVTGGTVYWTQYEYDARGRTTKVTPPLNAGYTTYLYVGNTVKVTDPAGRYKIHTVDVMGNLTKVSEKNPAGGADLDTFYTYNMADKLTQVSMTRGSTTQLRTFGYDSAFRLQTETKPETGTTTYTYDSMGRPSTKVDAKNQKVENVYDAYGRVTMVKRYPVSTGAEDVNQRTTNTYDYDGSGSATRNIWGRLAAVSIPNAVTEHYSYTSAGLLTSKASDYGGTSYMTPTVDYSYDNEGKVTQMVYPQYGRLNTPTTYDIFPRLTLNYGYDAMGQLQKVTSGSGPGVDLVNSATYNAAGQLLSSMRATTVGVSSTTDLPTGASLGLETFQYNGRNQLTEQTGLGTDINYWYSATANDGRLAQKHNWVTGEEENYTYDSLGRLATAYTTGTQWGLSFVYDGFGNRLQQNVTKGTAPSTVQTVDTATNRLNGAGFGYDSNGNMTGWSTPSGSVTASYDIENRMTQIVTPSVTETYKYGPGNLRVKKYQGGTWTYTVYGQGGEALGTFTGCSVGGVSFLCEAKLRVYFGGRLVLNGWTGVKPDRLGSPDGTHGRVYPYGEVSGAVTVDQDETFTTYKRDVGTGLDYAQNRYYASSWGRFTTADPYRASGGPANPQSWNRYAYVENDPVSFTDRSGLMLMSPDEEDQFRCFNMAGGIGGFGYAARSCYLGGGLGGGAVEMTGWSGGAPGEEQSTPPRKFDPKPGLQGLKDNAIASAGHILRTNPTCASIFGATGPSPAVLLEALASGNTEYGWIQYGSISKPTISATTQVYIVEPGAEIEQGAAITINDSLGSNWFLGSDTDRILTILHELAHAYDVIYGGNRLANDSGNTQESIANDAWIKEHCAP